MRTICCQVAQLALVAAAWMPTSVFAQPATTVEHFEEGTTFPVDYPAETEATVVYPADPDYYAIESDEAYVPAAPACGPCEIGVACEPEAEAEPCFRPFVHADYLYFRPRRRGADFVVVDDHLDIVSEGPIETVDWQRNSGVRVGVGFEIPEGQWGFHVQYSYLESSDERSFDAPIDGSLLPTRTRPNMIAEVDFASARALFEYHVWDAEFLRPVIDEENFRLLLHGGARFAIIEQDLMIRYSGIDADNAVVNAPIDFDGAGLRTGASSAWTIWRGLHLYGNVFVSLLSGEFETMLVETDRNGAMPITDIHETYRSFVPVLEMGIGFGWESEHFFVRVGYEAANWFDMVDSPDGADDTHPGKYVFRTSDLSLDGLVVSLGARY